jgi:hypothetical protein
MEANESSVHLVEKVLAYIARADGLQALAASASTVTKKAEYLDIAAQWLTLAIKRRKFLGDFAAVDPIDQDSN